MYKFKLQALLNHRKYQEEILQKELAQRKEYLQQQKHKLQQVKQNRRQCEMDFRGQQRKGNSAAYAQLFLSYLDRLNRDLENQYQQVSAARERFKQKRAELIEAAKKRKMLEKLKEKDRQRHQQQALKRERLLLDDVAAASFARKNS